MSEIVVERVNVSRELLTELRERIEPDRLREQADAMQGLIDRMPVRSLVRKIDAALSERAEGE